MGENYKLKTTDNIRYYGVDCYYTRGIIRNLPKKDSAILFFREEIKEHRDDLDILISGCDLCPPESTGQFWVNITTLDDSGGVVECECGEFYLHPAKTSGAISEDVREKNTEERIESSGQCLKGLLSFF